MVAKNNPFNIRNNKHNKWCGQVGSRKGFCTFHSRVYGIRAAAIILMRSYPRFDIVTVKDIISRWAPPSENDTDNYILSVCASTGFFKNTCMVTQMDYCYLLHAMSKMEGNIVPLDEIVQVCNLYDIQPLLKL